LCVACVRFAYVLCSVTFFCVRCLSCVSVGMSCVCMLSVWVLCVYCVLEALCKAHWSSILCWSRDSQACWLSVEQERLTASYSIKFVPKRSTCLPSTFVADLVTELRIAFPGVPQQLNLFLSKANILILFCFWVHEFCGSVLIERTGDKPQSKHSCYAY